MSGTSYRVDETYIKVGKTCKYLYRAVDNEGNTVEFMLSAKRDVSAAKRFFKKLMRAEHRRLPFSISVDKNAACPEAFAVSQAEGVVPKDCQLRRVKCLNKVIEQDHRFIKKKVRASQCFKRFHSAERTLEGIEAVKMIRKGQVKRLAGSDALGQAKFAASLFQIAAQGRVARDLLHSKIIFATLPFPVGVRTGSSYTGTLVLDNVSFNAQLSALGPMSRHNIHMIQSAGTITANACVFDGWDVGNTGECAIRVEGRTTPSSLASRVSVTGSEFRRNDPDIELQNFFVATVTGNMFKTGMQIQTGAHNWGGALASHYKESGNVIY